MPPPGRHGLIAWRMAVLSTCRAPSLGRHVHRELLRSVLLDVTPIIAATACHQKNYVERYSRFNEVSREGAFSCARDRHGDDAVACLPRTVGPHPHGRL